VTNNNVLRDSVLSRSDDVNGVADAMQDNWRVMDALQIGCRSADGDAMGCSHLLVRPGSFVDVAVSFDIVTHVTRKSRHAAQKSSTRIYLKLLHVFLLADRNEEVSQIDLNG
jgi:hypothetical protein